MEAETTTRGAFGDAAPARAQVGVPEASECTRPAVPGDPAPPLAFLTDGPVHVDGEQRIVPVYGMNGDADAVESVAALMRRRHPGMAVEAYAWDGFDPDSGLVGCRGGFVGAVEKLAAEGAGGGPEILHHLAAVEADGTAPDRAAALVLAVAAPGRRALENFLVHAKLLAD